MGFVELLAIEVDEVGVVGTARAAATGVVEELLDVFGFAQR